MLRGLYTSALGMTTQMNRLDVISNNIANVNTTGYKKDKVITQSFSDELMKRLSQNEPANALGVNYGMLSNLNISNTGRYSKGVFVDDVSVDFSVGNLKTTNGTYDLAIAGDGFFSVNYTDINGNSSERYTRDGAFTLGGNRVLTTKDGYAVLSESGQNIVVPDGFVSITEDGRVYSNGEYIDKIKMVDFEDKTLLRKQGDNLYTALDGAGQKAFSSAVVQGTLEMSNVNTVREMVEMIEITRAYEANQKMIQTHDSTLSKAVTEIGRK